MTLTPFLDLVIIKPDTASETTNSGIILPSESIKRPLTGTIVKIGKGSYAPNTGIFIPTVLSEGTRVLHKKHGNTEFEHEGEIYLLMKESNIEAIL